MGGVSPSIKQVEMIKCLKGQKDLGLLCDSVVQKWLSIELSGQLKRDRPDAEKQAMSS